MDKEGMGQVGIVNITPETEAAYARLSGAAAFGTAAVGPACSGQVGELHLDDAPLKPPSLDELLAIQAMPAYEWVVRSAFMSGKVNAEQRSAYYGPSSRP